MVSSPRACARIGTYSTGTGGLFSRDDVTLDEVRAVDRMKLKQPGQEGLMCEMLWTDPQDANGRGPSKRVRLPARPNSARASVDLFVSGGGPRFWPRHHTEMDRKEQHHRHHSKSRSTARRLFGRAQRFVHHHFLGTQLCTCDSTLEAHLVSVSFAHDRFVAETGGSGWQSGCIRNDRRHRRNRVYDVLGATSSSR